MATQAWTMPPAAAELADRFVREGVVPAGKPEDAGHVPAAFIEEMDVLVSWNSGTSVTSPTCDARSASTP